MGSSLSWRANIIYLLDRKEWENALFLWLERQPYKTALRKVLVCLAPHSKNSIWNDCYHDCSVWLTTSDDVLRWRIFQYSQQLGFDTPMGALGLSLFWSEGSMTASELEPVYPEASLSTQMLLCAMKLISHDMSALQSPIFGARMLIDRLLNDERA